MSARQDIRLKAAFDIIGTVCFVIMLHAANFRFRSIELSFRRVFVPMGLTPICPRDLRVTAFLIVQ